MVRQPRSNSTRQRALIAGLAVALTVGLVSSTQAGIIPWVYDVIFGPVHRPVHSYSPGPVYSHPQPQIGYTYPSRSYPATYSYSGYAGGFGCGPCRPSPSQCGPCANSGGAVGSSTTKSNAPTTIAFYHPLYGWVEQSCATDKPVRTAAKTGVGSKAPEPKPTFAEEIDPVTGKKKDPFVAPTTSVKKPVNARNGEKTDAADTKSDDKSAKSDGAAGTTTTVESDKATAEPKHDNKTTTTTTTSSDDQGNDNKSTEDTKTNDKKSSAKTDTPDGGFAEPKRGKEEFVSPKDGKVEAKEDKAIEKTDKLEIDGLNEELKLDDKASWLVPTLDIKRVAFRPGFRNARLARRSEVIGLDFVIPATSITRIVSK
jgi:hypothetical protein